MRTGHASITSRLTRMNLLVSGVALVLACVAFLLYDLYAFQGAIVTNLSTEAQIIGSNSISAITFNDAQSARTTLSALKAATGIISAGILTPDGRIFAEYSRSHEETLRVPRIPPGQSEAHVFSANDVVLVHSIVFEGRTLGVVYLRSDLSRLQHRFLRYLLISGMVMLLSLLAALLIPPAIVVPSRAPSSVWRRPRALSRKAKTTPCASKPTPSIAKSPPSMTTSTKCCRRFSGAIRSCRTPSSNSSSAWKNAPGNSPPPIASSKASPTRCPTILEIRSTSSPITAT